MRLDADTVVLVSPDGARAWISVPFPPLATGADVLTSLVEHATARRIVGVLLARRGGYAAGVFDGPDLIASKVGSNYVQGTTKAGGWSQKRYARRRDNQAQAALEDAADAAARVFTGAPKLDALVLGGDRRSVESVLDDPRLAGLRPLVTGPLLAVADPRLKVLRDTPELFQAVRIALHP